MEQGAIEILKKHGCLYMKDDYKALFDELEAYYKPTEAVKNNAALPHVSNWVAITDALPNANEEVLTITEDGWYRVMTYGSTGSRFPSQVTHWMHLPKPPWC